VDAEAEALPGKVGKCTWTHCHAVMIRDRGPRSLRIPPWPPFGRAWPETTTTSILDIDSISRPKTSKGGGTCPPIFLKTVLSIGPPRDFSLAKPQASQLPSRHLAWANRTYHYHQSPLAFLRMCPPSQGVKKPILPVSKPGMCSDVALLKKSCRRRKKTDIPTEFLKTPA